MSMKQVDSEIDITQSKLHLQVTDNEENVQLLSEILHTEVSDAKVN